ncbi:TetR/AcrR family transcriptional regulator [Bradyrhizobium tropiciagri]|uniref:TetR/AcrR family transcriptional regulator n=1 Tax=Bradyrhizobium tropiciagri TaxID=312253 RepID=UPI001BA5FF0D|nr:TetR/AcrR family transcriptional regulator [Bradyrhizobium tropiciagri]MBR0899029.1 TetR/AcrR family transcriptional regulator [Bradyrhizobium tropiciagri]
MPNSDKTSRSKHSRPDRIAAPGGRQRLRSRRQATADPKHTSRRTQAERTEATRKLLLEAAVKLIRKNGFGGLRTVEVADEAGVSRGALMHHFPSKHELVVAVLTYVSEVTFTRSTRRAQLARHDGGDPIASVIEDAHDFFFGDYFFIELAIAMSDDSTRRLRLETRQFVRQTRFSIEATWLDTMISSGIPERLAQDVLALTLSVVRGFSVRMLIENDPEHFSRLLELWRKIIRQHIQDSTPSPTRKRT